MQLESYTILSRQILPGEKPIDEIVLVPSLSRALILSGTSVHYRLHERVHATFSCSFSLDHQIYFYNIPSLDPFPIKPVRNVITFAVDDQHLKRTFPTLSAAGVPLPPEAVDFSVVKRNGGIALFTMKDRLVYTKVCQVSLESPSRNLIYLVSRKSLYIRGPSLLDVLERRCVWLIGVSTVSWISKLLRSSKFCLFLKQRTRHRLSDRP